MAKKSPWIKVKEEFSNKEALVQAVKALAGEGLWLDRSNQDKGLQRVSNRKLLRLHALLSQASTQFGSRAQLIAQIQALHKRSKDDGYRARLDKFPLPRLLDQFRVAQRHAKANN